MDIEYVLTQVAALYLKLLAIYVTYKIAQGGSVASPTKSTAKRERAFHYFLAIVAPAGVALYAAYVMKTVLGSFGYSTAGIVYGSLVIAACAGVNEGHKSPPKHKNIGPSEIDSDANIG